VRDHVVSVEIPGRSTGTQRVRIVARNEDGTEHTAYEEDHQPGDRFEQTVTTTGARGRCRILIYINGRLRKTETL
jgi:hypothetical protein